MDVARVCLTGDLQRVVAGASLTGAHDRPSRASSGSSSSNGGSGAPKDGATMSEVSSATSAKRTTNRTTKRAIKRSLAEGDEKRSARSSSTAVAAPAAAAVVQQPSEAKHDVATTSDVPDQSVGSNESDGLTVTPLEGDNGDLVSALLSLSERAPRANEGGSALGPRALRSLPLSNSLAIASTSASGPTPASWSASAPTPASSSASAPSPVPGGSTSTCVPTCS